MFKLKFDSWQKPRQQNLTVFLNALSTYEWNNSHKIPKKEKVQKDFTLILI